MESETEILRRISHPNIVKLFVEYESVKEIFLVLELVTVSLFFVHESQSLERICL